MRMLVWVATALAALSLGSSSVWAEETLVVVDAAGTVLGPVVGQAPIVSTSDKDDFYFVYRVADTFVVLRILDSETVSTLGTSYGQLEDAVLLWSGTGCGGTLLGIGSAHVSFVTDEIRRFPNTNELWRIHTELATPKLTGSEERFVEGVPGSICEDMNPGGEMRSSTSWDVLGTLTFIPPLRVVLNPLLFNDGFGTGDPTRWSNY